MTHQLKVTLKEVMPPVWRRITMPSRSTLFDLHRAIQLAMGWENCHLHDFTIGRQRFALPHFEDEVPGLDESIAKLRDVAPAGTRFLYQYDFGDSWIHNILVEEVVVDDDALPPACIGGARACPPEDSGGPWGYAEKLQALAGPDDEETEELREWMGEDFDAERFEMAAVNRALGIAFRPEPRRTRRPKRKE